MTKDEAKTILSMIYKASIKTCKEKGLIEETEMYHEALHMAIEALQKRIPEEVKWRADTTWGVKTKEPACPVCGCDVVRIEFLGNKKTSYCEYCGQALEWG